VETVAVAAVAARIETSKGFFSMSISYGFVFDDRTGSIATCMSFPALASDNA